MVNKEEKWIIKRELQEVSNIKFNGNFSSKNLHKIYKNRKLHRWYGYVYLLFQTLDSQGKQVDVRFKNGQIITNGKFVVGFTTKRWVERWYHYKLDALKYGKTQEVHQLISTLQNAGINLDNAFDWDILEFCWTDSKLRTREADWIDRLNAKNPLLGGLNTISGGSGGSKVSIPRSVLIPYIASVFWQMEILRFLKKKYKIGLTIDVVRQRIVDYWGSMEEARVKFLLPILKNLFRNGYSSEYLTNNVFNRTPHTINSWSKNFWNKTAETKRKELLKENLAYLIINGLEYREIDENLRGLPWSTINDYIIRWWGGLKKARSILMKPIIAEALENSLEPIKIARTLGHEDIGRVRKFIHIFWNIPNALKGDWNPINDFIFSVRKLGLSKEEILHLTHDKLLRRLKEVKERDASLIKRMVIGLNITITLEDLKEFNIDNPEIPAFKNGHPTKEFISWLIKKGKMKENIDIALPISPQGFNKKKSSKHQEKIQTNLSSEYPNAYINTEYPNPLNNQIEQEEEDLNESWLWFSKQVRDDNLKMINRLLESTRNRDIEKSKGFSKEEPSKYREREELENFFSEKESLDPDLGSAISESKLIPPSQIDLNELSTTNIPDITKNQPLNPLVNQIDLDAFKSYPSSVSSEIPIPEEHHYSEREVIFSLSRNIKFSKIS